MSVPSYKRKESSLEYVENCLKLTTTTIKNCIRFPKRLSRYITQYVVETSHTIYHDILFIKTTFNSVNEDIQNQRLRKCEEVIEKLDYMSTLMTILYEESKDTLSFNTWSEWTSLLERLKNLIYGVKTKHNEIIHKKNQTN